MPSPLLRVKNAECHFHSRRVSPAVLLRRGCSCGLHTEKSGQMCCMGLAQDFSLDDVAGTGALVNRAGLGYTACWCLVTWRSLLVPVSFPCWSTTFCSKEKPAARGITQAPHHADNASNHRGQLALSCSVRRLPSARLHNERKGLSAKTTGENTSTCAPTQKRIHGKDGGLGRLRVIQASLHLVPLSVPTLESRALPSQLETLSEPAWRVSSECCNKKSSRD